MRDSAIPNQDMRVASDAKAMAAQQEEWDQRYKLDMLIALIRCAPPEDVRAAITALRPIAAKVVASV